MTTQATLKTQGTSAKHLIRMKWQEYMESWHFVSNFDGKEDWYFDHEFLEKTITEDFVIKALDMTEELMQEEEKFLVRFIIDKAKKIFATWLLVNTIELGINLRACMQEFEKRGVTDAGLPVNEYSMIFVNLRWFKERHDIVKIFCAKQWCFLVPTISTAYGRSEIEYEHPKGMLPPLELVHNIPREDYQSDGSFHGVRKYRVNPKRFIDNAKLVGLFSPQKNSD